MSSWPETLLNAVPPCQALAGGSRRLRHGPVLVHARVPSARPAPWHRSEVQLPAQSPSPAPWQCVLQGAPSAPDQSSRIDAGIQPGAAVLHRRVVSGALLCGGVLKGLWLVVFPLTEHGGMDGDTQQDLARGAGGEAGDFGHRFHLCCQLAGDSSKSFPTRSCPLGPLLLNEAVAVTPAHSLLGFPGPAVPGGIRPKLCLEA